MLCPNVVVLGEKKEMFGAGGKVGIYSRPESESDCNSRGPFVNSLS